ncbi:alpha/beta fold hydrolase [Acidobacteria bacterium AH-259-L09]|nr:alpha/beta fold hydrolase [Acidobacteria bacterium AH-259-L09]
MRLGRSTLRSPLVLMLCTLISQSCAAQQVKDHVFDSGGVPIRYRVSGSGPGVILLHGFGGDLDDWYEAGIVDILSDQFRVLAMDVRGHGQSGKPHDPQSYGQEIVEDVRRVLDHSEIPAAHIAGYSMGSLIALDFATRYQERTLSVVVGGQGWASPSDVERLHGEADALQRRGTGASNAMDVTALAALLRGVRPLTEAQVRSIHSPVLALIGAEDRFMPSVKRLSELLPTTEVRVIPGATHATAFGHPEFSKRMTEFLVGVEFGSQ